MHQVVTAQLAARRSGTQSTKTRAEVRGGGAKPWKQKGTGRARQGSIRAPHWRGGGVALGPEAPQLRPAHPQEDDPAGPALGAVRSGRRGQGHRRRRVGLRRPEHQGRHRRAERARRRGPRPRGRRRRRRRHLAELPQPARRSTCIAPGELNAYDVLVRDYVVFSRDTLPADPADASGRSRPRRPRRRPQAGQAAGPSRPRRRPGRAEGDGRGRPRDRRPPRPGGEADMASDLPNRPKPIRRSSEAASIPPTGSRAWPTRTDPRFEAARKKAEQGSRGRAPPKEAAETRRRDRRPTPTSADDRGRSRAVGFSFNQTTDGATARTSEGPPRRHHRTDREREVVRAARPERLHVQGPPRRQQARDRRRRPGRSSTSRCSR